MRFPGRELHDLLGAALPTDDARQSLAERCAAGAAVGVADRPWRVLDLGCGHGDSVDLFRDRDPGVEWVGLDIPDSPEAKGRVRTDARFETFDGVSIPFEDESFDLVYCKQVLEHVGRPRPLLSEVRRVLASGGAFAGSTSQLEPFHSYSYWNYTPFGFCELLDEAGMELVEIRPGIDAATLIARRALGDRKPFDRLWARWWGGESPFNRLIDAYCRMRHLDVGETNANKLLFCGQFAFRARRGEP